jgi:hypothetical protein
VENALSYEKKGKLLTLEQIHLTPQTFIEYINRARFMQRTFSSSEETKTVNRRIVDKILEAINKKI